MRVLRHDIPLLLLLVATAFSGWLLVRPLSREARREMLHHTCWTGCPCCESVDKQGNIDYTRQLESTLALASALPADNLTSFRPIIDHLELYREFVLAERVRADGGPTTDVQTVAARDSSSLILGLYLRSLPSITGLCTHSGDVIRINDIANRTARAVLTSYEATDGLADGGATYLSSGAPSLSRIERQRMLKEALVVDPHCLYASIALDAMEAEELYDQADALPKEDLVLRAAAAQGSLLSAYLQWLCDKHPGIDKANVQQSLDPRSRKFAFEASLQESAEYCAYCVVFNNFADLECIRICCDATDPRAVVLRANLQSVIRFSSAATGVTAARIPVSLRIALAVTALELSVVSEATAVTPHVEGELRTILASIFANAGSQLDGRDATRVINYLRNGSARFRGLWTIAWFDNVCEQVKSSI